MKYSFCILLVIATLCPISAMAEISTKVQSNKTVIPAKVQYNELNIEELKCLAQKGDAEAQYRIGQKYAIGQDIPQDQAEAFLWYKKAAEQDHKPAQAAIVPILQELANQELAAAQYLLGNAYYTGQGTAQDYMQAQKWLEKAANNGYMEAKGAGALFYIYERGLGTTQDYIQARYWLEVAAEKGNVSAPLMLGMMYYYGLDETLQDPIKAVHWLRKGAEQGDVNAQELLALAYLEDHGVSKDYAESAKWSRRAAEKGSPRAQCNLASLYAHGLGVLKDDQEANKWFRKSAEQGYASAQASLGARYSVGVGMPKDYIQAYKWLNLAATQDSEYGKVRDSIESHMTSQQLQASQQLAREWLRNHPKKSNP
jgi:TPR repeat protein